MAILLSVKSEYVEKILNSDKTLEIRKSIPKCDLPCKVYIYCTKGQELWGDGTGETWYGIAEDEDIERVFELNPTLARLNGKVVAEFTLNKANKFDYVGLEFYDMKDLILKKSCLSESELKQYIKNQVCYAWHIDDLIIYDKPKELDNFVIGKVALDCGYGNYNIYNEVLKRPPQSWCYVEELKDNEV